MNNKTIAKELNKIANAIETKNKQTKKLSKVASTEDKTLVRIPGVIEASYTIGKDESGNIEYVSESFSPPIIISRSIYNERDKKRSLDALDKYIDASEKFLAGIKKYYSFLRLAHLDE